MGFWMKDNKEKAENVVPAKTKTDLLDSKTPGSIHPSEFAQTTDNGVSQPEIVDYFNKVFVENNIPGPDYQEFKNALEKMKSQPLDEATKIKTLWISFEAWGLTPQKLIDTAGHYKTI